MSRDLTLGEYMVGKVGLVKATKVAAFVVAWGIYTDKEPARPTLENYTEFWRQSVSSTYRERDLFRLCWPDQKDPTELWAKVRAVHNASLDAKRRDVGAVQLLALKVPGAF